MEERIVDKEDSRRIKLTAAGDAVEEGAETPAPSEAQDAPPTQDEIVEAEAEIVFEEQDEDLVGLTPAQLREEMERRRRAAEQARKEYERLVAAAGDRADAGKFEAAEPLYRQAMVYGQDGAAEMGLWRCITKDFSDTGRFYEIATAHEFSLASDEVKQAVLGKMGEKLEAERRRLTEEAAPLREAYTAASSKRREAFRLNKTYWLVRFFIAFALFAAFAVGAAVSAAYLTRTLTDVPVILLGVFAGLAAIALIVVFFFSRKLYLASRLVALNEKPSSTADGARLEEIDGALECLRYFLD